MICYNEAAFYEITIDNEVRMETTTVSPKYQIVIPKNIRRQMNIQPGQKLQVIQYGDRIELIPLREARELRGFIKGIDTTIEREPDRL